MTPTVPFYPFLKCVLIQHAYLVLLTVVFVKKNEKCLKKMSLKNNCYLSVNVVLRSEFNITNFKVTAYR